MKPADYFPMHEGAMIRIEYVPELKGFRGRCTECKWTTPLALTRYQANRMLRRHAWKCPN